MRKINYDGSIAKDVKAAKNSNAKLFLGALAGCALATGAVVTNGVLPDSVTLISLLAGGAGAITAGLKAVVNDFAKDNAKGRLYDLLDDLGLEEQSEHDMSVVNVDLAVKNVNEYEVRPGKYVVVRNNDEKVFIRESITETEEYYEYTQYLMDLEQDLDRKLAYKELSTSEDVIILKK